MGQNVRKKDPPYKPLYMPCYESHPLCGELPHFFLQFVQDMKVWLVLFGVLLELDHTLV